MRELHAHPNAQKNAKSMADMEKQAPDQSISERAAKLQEDLAGLVQVLIGDMNLRFAPAGVNTVEFTILNLCASSMGQITIRDMRQRLPIDPAQISRTVTQLEDKDLLHKVRLRSDQRVTTVRMTSWGAELMPDLMRRAQEYYGMIVRDISLEDLAACMGVMARMTGEAPSREAAFQAAPEGPPSLEALVFQLPGLLTNLVNLMYRGAQERLDPHNLSVVEYAVLTACFGNAPATIQGLLRQVPIDATQMSRVVSRLHDRKLVRRERSRTDRRVVRIRMTDAGRELAPETLRLVNEHYASVIRRVTGDELMGLIAFTEKMMANARIVGEQAEGYPPPPPPR